MIKKKGYITPVLRTHKVTIPRLLAESGELNDDGNGTTFSDINEEGGDYNGLFN